MSLISGVASSVEERLHGVVVRDPYRWLEDGDSAETRAWIADRQHRYEEYFRESADLNWFRSHVREHLDVETVDQPARIGTLYFYRRRNKGSEQACIYVRDSPTGQERLLINPSTKGRFASVGIHRISFDGSFLAYELKHGGTDRASIYIVDVGSGTELPDTIESGYARGFTFATDQKGFYYCHETVRAVGDHTIRFHRFGGQGPDKVVHRLPRSAGSRLILVSDEIHLGAIYIHRRAGEPVTDVSLAKRSSPTDWKSILRDLEGTYRPFLNNGRIFAISFRNAPNGKLLELNEDGHETRVVVPEQARQLQQLVVVGDRIVVTYRQNWGTVVESWTALGKHVGSLNIPTDGTIRLLRSHGSEGLFCTYESFGEPLATFEFQQNAGTVELWHKQISPVRQKFGHTQPLSVSSKDGTIIPLIMVSQKKPEFKATTPVIMTGYGGFGTSVTPQYSVLVSIMLDLGCTFVLAGIRGGGECGEAWHDAGRRGKRQNAFDDFIAVAEWLCAEKVTTPKRLAIFGGSNAGLLVGAALTQRPKLFGAVLCIAPLLDMVRYEKFDQAARWRHEYGSVDNAEDFRTLHAYSPYHHVEDDIDYPPVLFISGDRDDRCNPAHVRKMVARLQDRNIQTHPILMDYSSERGHSPVLPLSIRIESLARRILFLCRTLNVTQDRSSQ